MESISKQITDLYNAADEQGRKAIEDSLRELQSSLDEDIHALLRLASAVSKKRGLTYFCSVKIRVDTLPQAAAILSSEAWSRFTHIRVARCQR